MDAPLFKFVGPKVPYSNGRPGWSRKVEVNGVVYYVGIESRGRKQMPYKPRGTYGEQWMGFVRQADGTGRYYWSSRGNVNGSLGVKGLLKRSGLLGVNP